MCADWRRVSSILDVLLDAPPERRPALAATLCGDDHGLRDEVVALLEADARAGAFLSAPAALQGAPLLVRQGAPLLVRQGAPDEADLDVGRTIGAWRLVRPLGEGGMGRVFVAERSDGQFEQQAALKLLRSDRLGAGARSRFLHERQILAQLDHPAIARLLDGGVTEDRLPYFVMELVPGGGRSITAFASAARLGLPARLRLVLEVCAAVSYAHTRLVVHRDIKPSNVLVDDAGRVRLLDFGIAKLLDPTRADEPATRSAARVMTPEYAAPEQIRGDVITTATDVWALGILLYELLTGRRPFSTHEVLPGEVERAILEREPARPSAAADRALPYARHALRGDLDRIVLSALAKDPARRYPTVDALAGDLRRYLDGRPVLARGDAIAYRAGKFLRRHRLGAASAVLLALTLAGGMVGTIAQGRRADAARREAVRERDRARRRLAAVRRLASALLFDVNDAVADLPGGAAARDLVAATALEYLDGVARDDRADPSLEGELALAYERVGDASVSAGDPAKARRSYERAFAMRRALVERGGGRAAQLAAATTLRKLGDGLFLGGARDAALGRYRAAAALAESLLTAGTSDEPASRELLAVRGRLCARLDSAPERQEAIRACRQAATIGDALLDRAPRDAHLRAEVVATAARWAELTGGVTGRATRRPRGGTSATGTHVLAAADFADAPQVGTWRLRPKAGPRYSPFTALRVELVGRSLRFTYLDDDGHLVMTMTVVAEGRPTPIYGPDGRPFATLFWRRLDDRHFESWGDGLGYVYERATFSPDGMTWTSEARMRNPRGQEYTDIDVWEKQLPRRP